MGDKMTRDEIVKAILINAENMHFAAAKVFSIKQGIRAAESFYDTLESSEELVEAQATHDRAYAKIMYLVSREEFFV